MKHLKDETRDALVTDKRRLSERAGSWFRRVLLSARDASQAVACDHYALCALVVTLMIAGMLTYGASESSIVLMCFTVLFICVAVWKSPSTSERIHQAFVRIEDKEENNKQ